MNKTVNILLLVLVVMVFPVIAFADTLDPTIANAINEIIPNKAKEIIGVLSFVLVIWTQIRAVISPSILAKLPHSIIVILEVLAGNSNKSANATHNDPIEIKKSMSQSGNNKR